MMPASGGVGEKISVVVFDARQCNSEAVKKIYDACTDEIKDKILAHGVANFLVDAMVSSGKEDLAINLTAVCFPGRIVKKFVRYR